MAQSSYLLQSMIETTEKRIYHGSIMTGEFHIHYWRNGLTCYYGHRIES